jgi:hypothetical protein
MSEKRKNSDRITEDRAKRSAFWNGVLEGFSGPVMLGTSPRVPAPVRTKDGMMVTVRIATPSIGKSMQRIVRSVQLGTEDAIKKRGISVEVLKRRELDQDGKARERSIRVLKRNKADEPPQQP